MCAPTDVTTIALGILFVGLKCWVCLWDELAGDGNAEECNIPSFLIAISLLNVHGSGCAVIVTQGACRS